MTTVFFGLVAFAVCAWLPTFDFSLLLRTLISVGFFLAACACLLFNQRHPKYVVRFLLYVKACEMLYSSLLILLMVASLDATIYLASLSPVIHFNRVVEWITLLLITCGGIVLIRYPRLATAKVPDLVLNGIVIGLIIVAAWLIFPLTHALVGTGCGLVYLVLCHRYPWIPQFRQEPRPKGEKNEQ